MQKLLFIPLLFFASLVSAQDILIDSLRRELDSYTDYDENYVDLLNKVSFEYIKSDPSQSTYYINLAITISNELNYEKGLLRATSNKGSSYWVSGLHDESLSYYLLALSYNSESYPLEFIRINNNIAEVFKKKSMYDSAEKYYEMAVNMVKQKIPDDPPVILLSNIAEIYLMRNAIDSAQYYYQLCLDESIEQNDQRGLAYAYEGLAELAFRKFDIDNAIELQTKSIEIRKEINDVRGIIQSMQFLGVYLIHQSKVDSAFSLWDKAEEIAFDYKALDLLNDIYLTKYEYYYFLGEYKRATEYVRNFKLLSDSLQSQEFMSSLNRMKNALLSEVKEAENRALRQQQIRERIVNRIRLITIAISFLLFIGVVYFVYKSRSKSSRRIEAEKEQSFTNSLLKLSKEVNLKQPDFDQFISDFLKTSCKALACDRASYWYYDPDNECMKCFQLLENGRFKKSPKPLNKKDYPAFYKGLMSNRTIAIDNVNDSRYTDLSQQVLMVTKIKSLLFASLFLNDKIIGFIAFSSIKNLRSWTFAEQRYVGSLADIIISAFAYNESKILEKEKEKLIDKLQIRNSSLREFNSVISHNLREPLTQVIGFSSILSTSIEDPDSETSKIITNISNASERLDRAIKDLSTVLNEKDPTKKDYRNTKISKVLKEVFDLLPNEMKSYTPEINQNLEVDKITTYKPFLFDILYHIIVNSFKFSDPERLLKIEISSHQENNKNIISVQDNGIGMNLTQFKDKIFKMYQRFHLNTEGRGIGLYLAKNRASSLGGDIEVKSRQNKGTEFIIILPQSIPLNAS